MRTSNTSKARRIRKSGRTIRSSVLKMFGRSSQPITTAYIAKHTSRSVGMAAIRRIIRLLLGQGLIQVLGYNGNQPMYRVSVA